LNQKFLDRTDCLTLAMLGVVAEAKEVSGAKIVNGILAALLS
jgi:hypothetical protein